MANDDFGRFGRRSVGGGDDFESMRAQMAKERDAFFRDSGDWGMEPPSQSRAGYFTTVIVFVIYSTHFYSEILCIFDG